MMILAIDGATTLGFAWGRTGCDVPEFGSRNFAGPGGNGEVIAKARQWLNQRCYALRPGLVVFEAPFIPMGPARPGRRPMNMTTLRRLIGLTETIAAVCWELRIECREATVLEIARFFVGTQRFPGATADERRRAKKACTIEMCGAFGWDVQGNDDAADALALWSMAECQVDPRAHSQRGGEGALFLRAAAQRAAQTRNAPRRQPRSARNKPADERTSSLWPTEPM